MATLEVIDINSTEVVVRGARVLDVERGELRPEAGVRISGGIIESLEAAGPQRGCAEVPADGLTLMPGLIDCHAHILSPWFTKQEGENIFAPWVFRQMGRNLRTELASGVLVVRDMLSPIRIMNKVRWLIEKGRIPGPRIIASGAIMSCPGGYPEFVHPLGFPAVNIAGTPKYELTTVAAAEKAVRYVRKCGADLIKVGYSSRDRYNSGPDTMPVISKEILDVICRTAHSLGLIVSVHHNWGEDIGRILQSDVDTIEHLINDRVMTDEEVQLMKSRGIRVVPTLTIMHDMSYFDKKTDFFKSQASHDLFEPEAHKHLAFVSRTWLDKNEMSYDEVFGIWRANRESYEFVKDSAKKLCEAGVPLLAGTDYGAVCAFGGELAEEIRRLTLIGMSNADAVRSATIRAAELLGIGDGTGSIEKGKRADLILVEGNPLEDITALARVRMISKDGRWYRPGGDTATPFWNSDYDFI